MNVNQKSRIGEVKNCYCITVLAVLFTCEWGRTSNDFIIMKRYFCSATVIYVLLLFAHRHCIVLEYILFVHREKMKNHSKRLLVYVEERYSRASLVCALCTRHLSTVLHIRQFCGDNTKIEMSNRSEWDRFHFILLTVSRTIHGTSSSSSS